MQNIPFAACKLQSTGESDMTRAERREIEGERDRLRVELEQAQLRATTLQQRLDEVEGERDRERAERVRVRMELEYSETQLMVGKQEAEAERDRAMVELQQALASANTLQQGLDEAERERDRLQLELEGNRYRVREALQQAQVRANDLQRRLNEVEGREQEKLIVREQAITAEQRGPSWEVKEDELEVTDQRLGVGGWAEVKVAKLKVAAKILHQQLIYDYHRHLFRREMDVAARVSHPNLLRFLGARLEGGMAILTEFMPTSLRALVNRRPRQRLTLQHILSIGIDVACALNYLHHMTPDPIIHRDLSSANILLQPTPNGGWLAKVSDYGTANFQSRLQTENPGSPVYTAPESRDPALQTPKMDIYSFGVVLVEMCTCEFPAPERRAELIQSIQYPQLVNLITRCLNEDPDHRPTAAELIDLLQAMQ